MSKWGRRDEVDKEEKTYSKLQKGRRNHCWIVSYILCCWLARQIETMDRFLNRSARAPINDWIEEDPLPLIAPLLLKSPEGSKKSCLFTLILIQTFELNYQRTLVFHNNFLWLLPNQQNYVFQVIFMIFWIRNSINKLD